MKKKIKFTGLVLSAALGLVVLSVAQENRDPKDTQAPAIEVKKLISELGDPSFRIRENATKRLSEIGLPALDALREAEENGNSEIERRAALLTRKISIANRLPVRVKGMEFELHVEDSWRIPEAGKATAIRMSIQITNRTNSVYRVYLMDRLKPVLKGPDGYAFVFRGGRQMASKSAAISAPLRRNESAILSFDAKLTLALGKLSFSLQDIFTSYWQVSELSAGGYELGAVYENRKQQLDDTAPLWVGRAEIGSEIIQIK